MPHLSLLLGFLLYFPCLVHQIVSIFDFFHLFDLFEDAIEHVNDFDDNTIDELTMLEETMLQIHNADNQTISLELCLHSS